MDIIKEDIKTDQHTMLPALTVTKLATSQEFVTVVNYSREHSHKRYNSTYYQCCEPRSNCIFPAIKSAPTIEIQMSLLNGLTTVLTLPDSGVEISIAAQGLLLSP